MRKFKQEFELFVTIFFDISLLQKETPTKNPTAKRKQGRPQKELNGASRRRLARQEDYVRTYTGYMGHIRSMPRTDGGLVKYSTTYGRISTGKYARLFAKNIYPQTAPRIISEIAYEGIGARDCDAGSAYFDFAFHAIGEQRIEIPHAHFQLSTVGRHTSDRESAWESLQSAKKDTPIAKVDLSSRSYSPDRKYPMSSSRTSYLAVYRARGGALRWISSYIPPELYDRLRSDPCKKWPEASDLSYFLDGVESRATFAFYEYCADLCIGDGGPEPLHMSLQFDGDDLSTRPFPDNFRSLSERRVEDRTGPRVNLVEKKRNFFAEYVASEAIDVANAAPPQRDSVVGKSGNCIPLATYRLEGNPELAKVPEDVIRGEGGRLPSAMSYKECLKLVGAGCLTYADTSQISVG